MSEPYAIEFDEGVVEELKDLKRFDRAKLLDEIEEQLSHEPTTPTKRRKPLHGLIPPWEHVPPIWELRIEDYRVFYDVDDKEQIVKIRAIRRKPPHSTTEEIL